MGIRRIDRVAVSAGATIALDGAATVLDADIILKVRRPSEGELKSYKPGAIVVATMDPYGHEADVKAMAAAAVPLEAWSIPRNLNEGVEMKKKAGPSTGPAG